MTFPIEPVRDLDSILCSWLNMNLSKSQSGSYVPISFSKY